MNYTDALDLARRIKQERPDVLTWTMGYREGALVMVRKLDRRDGHYPVKQGPPYFIDSEQEWESLKHQIT